MWGYVVVFDSRDDCFCVGAPSHTTGEDGAVLFYKAAHFFLGCPCAKPLTQSCSPRGAPCDWQ
eukprot:5055994-Pyramimonas_sp.AAC.1